MLKCLSNASLEFHNGSEKAHAKVGFNELPDWVEKTQYYKDAVKHKVITPFDSNVSDANTEAALKEQEKIAALKDEVKALEEQKESLESYKKDTTKEIKALEKKKAELEKAIEG